MVQRDRKIPLKPTKSRTALAITHPNATGIDIGRASHHVVESRGFTVLLVNARHVKNVWGRKSDVLECQWLQQLMTYGLFSGAFRPADAFCVLRSLWRQRGMLLRIQGRRTCKKRRSPG